MLNTRDADRLGTTLQKLKLGILLACGQKQWEWNIKQELFGLNKIINSVGISGVSMFCELAMKDKTLSFDELSKKVIRRLLLK
jgi:hypothetical protein